MNPTRHCHHCGTDYGFNRNPGRSETCLKCQADLKVCLNCMFYDTSVAYQCGERRADPVVDKHLANYCEFFEMAKRVWAARPGDKREDTARANLKKLLGD